jgi:hypothetical protein
MAITSSPLMSTIGSSESEESNRIRSPEEARAMASRSEPGPLSLVLVTVKVVAWMVEDEVKIKNKAARRGQLLTSCLMAVPKCRFLQIISLF